MILCIFFCISSVIAVLAAATSTAELSIALYPNNCVLYSVGNNHALPITDRYSTLNVPSCQTQLLKLVFILGDQGKMCTNVDCPIQLTSACAHRFLAKPVLKCYLQDNGLGARFRI